MGAVRYIVYVHPKDGNSTIMKSFRRNSELDMYLHILGVVSDVEDYLNLLDNRNTVKKTKVTWKGVFESEKVKVKVTCRYYH